MPDEDPFGASEEMMEEIEEMDAKASNQTLTEELDDLAFRRSRRYRRRRSNRVPKSWDWR